MPAKTTYVLRNPLLVGLRHTNQLYKIGESADPDKRLAEINARGPDHFEIWMQFPSDKPGLERYLHAHFPSLWHNGEYYSVPPEKLAEFEQVCRTAYADWQRFEKEERDLSTEVADAATGPLAEEDSTSETDTVKTYRRIKEFEGRKRMLEAKVEHLKTKLKRDMVTTKTLEIYDSTGSVGKVTWKPIKTTRFDPAKAKAFLTQEQAEQCMTSSETRVMRIY
tara:strand:+ start:22 stop:687 length:666 start_codon:yes stop_codon:yes gene_type:complete